MQVGQVIGQVFAVEKEIGAGAMGAVYRARYVKTGLPVAIKIITTGLDDNPTALARFERESAILKRLNHPHIVRLYATGRVRGKPFYAMEFVEGETLESALARRGRFSWEEVVTLGQQICAALQHAHEQGIVHRDLKPANVMTAEDGTVKLTDFGIAKGLEAGKLTATNTTLGTAAYMSPEQCRGERDLTFKADLYSLGVVFYELLTGRLPFQEDTTLAMFLAHVQGQLERPSRLALDIPIWLDTLVCQLLEKDPDKRPMNAEIVGQSLGRILDKVQAQRSAGVDLLSTRVSDRPRTDFRPDEKDREAARTLKAAVTRKRRRRKTVPLYGRVWVKALGLSTALALLAGAVYWATRPPSPHAYYLRVQKLLASEDPDDHDKARKVLGEFLDHYAKLSGEEADELRARADQIDVAALEHALRNRMKRQMEPDSETEGRARSAIQYELAGELDSAKKTWEPIVELKEANDPDQAVYGKLAAKRLKDLAAAAGKEAELRRKLARCRPNGKPVQTPDDTEARAARALHLEEFGDVPGALAAWKELRLRLDEKEDGQRAWFLVVVRHQKELEPREKKSLHAYELIKKRLQGFEELTSPKAADVKQPDPPKPDPKKLRQARLACRDIEVLYDAKDPDLGDLVQKARDLEARLSELLAEDDQP